MGLIQITRTTPKTLIRETIKLTLQRLGEVEFDCSYMNDPTHKSWEGNIMYKPAHHFYLGSVSSDTVEQPLPVFTLYLDYTNGGSETYASTRCEEKYLPGFWHATSKNWTAQFLSDAIILALSIGAGSITHSEAVKEGQRMGLRSLGEWTVCLSNLEGSTHTRKECWLYWRQKHTQRQGV